MEAQCHAIQPRRLKDFLLDQNLPFPRYTRKSPLSIFIKAVKSSSILRRSISRRFSKKNSSLSSCVPLIDHTKAISTTGDSHSATSVESIRGVAGEGRRNVMLKQQIQDFENLIEVEDRCLVNKNAALDDVESFEIEEKAIQLMDHVKTTSSTKESLDVTMDVMLLDFFRDELSTTKDQNNRWKIMQSKGCLSHSKKSMG
ncbi:hypothetical protein Tco_0635690 [Tanacetum coccineum]